MSENAAASKETDRSLQSWTPEATAEREGSVRTREYEDQLREAFLRNNSEQQAKLQVKKSSSIKASIFDLVSDCQMQVSRFLRRYKDIYFYTATKALSRTRTPSRDNGGNMNNESKGSASQSMSTGLAAYEEAVKDFSTSATEFLRCIPLLTKARDAYERAIKASAQVRKTLDSGDETLRNFMTQIQDAVSFQPDQATAVETERAGIETIKASEEKADAARA
jgi:exonuclease VII small subunit